MAQDQAEPDSAEQPSPEQGTAGQDSTEEQPSTEQESAEQPAAEQGAAEQDSTEEQPPTEPESAEQPAEPASTEPVSAEQDAAEPASTEPASAEEDSAREDSVDAELRALEAEAQGEAASGPEPSAPAGAASAGAVLAKPGRGSAEPVDAAAPNDGIDSVTVTGSRIKRKSIASSAPVTVITTQDMLAVGRPSVAEILQRLPAAANAINLQFNNGGIGAARINLRSLGVNRTLVLINGRRFVSGGDGPDASVDLNAIPTSIIDRIEVLKDGGSAVYGSDAISGVVNIITKKNFVGAEASAYNSITARGDGRIYQVDLTGGLDSADGRSNLIFSAQFLDQQPIFAGERDFSKVARSFDFDAFAAAGSPNGTLDPFLSNVGSSGVPGGRILDLSGAPGNAAWDALNCYRTACQNGSSGAGDLGQGWRPSGGDEDLYNFQPENYLSTPFQRLSLYSLGNYRLSDYLGFFFEGSLTRRESQQLLAATPLFTSQESLTVSGDNRYNPFGRDFSDVRRRMVEAGNRVFDQESTTTRVVIGMEGDIPSGGLGWSWDAYVNYGRTDTTNLVAGRFNRTRLARALGPDADCTGDCVPLDLFGGPGSITQDMVDSISFIGVDRGYSEQSVAAANVGGNLFHLLAEDPVAVSLGYQFRREEGADTPNPLTASGDSTGNKRNPTAGSFDVNAAYAEVAAPLLSNRPGVQHLELSAAARFVHFSSFGSNTTYKAGLRYNPNRFFALRGTASTAFRAPSVLELFGGQEDDFPNVSDPCSTIRGALDNPTVAANCAADGLEDGVPDPNVQLRAREGGSPELEAETAETITLGVVLENQLIKGLTASADFYSIKIDNAIETVGSAIILASCYQQPGASRTFCDRIQRDNNGFIRDIIDGETNVSGFSARGIDLGLRYDSPAFNFGRLGAGVDATIVLDLTQTQPDGFEQSYAGNYDQAAGSDPGANPRYRINAFARWAYDIFNAGVNFRYLPSFDECEGGACDVNSPDSPIARAVDDYFYMDLYAGLNLLSPVGATNVAVGMNNVTDATPPFIASGFLAESDAATYDYAGRSLYLRLTQQF